MKNFPFEYEGKTYWYSRATSCATVITAFNKDGKKCMLIVQRGKGAESKIGKWSVPGGYLDFDETLEGCAKREAFEESGVIINKPLSLLTILDDPGTYKQTVIHLFYVRMDEKCEDIKITSEHSEPNEVSSIKWVPLDEIDSVDWAFVSAEDWKQIFDFNRIA